MGLIFDKQTAQFYKFWYRSAQGRTIDNSIEQLILNVLRPKPRDRVLDIGCGSGNHLIVFNRLGLDVSGVDASSHMIHEAEARLGHRCSLRTGTAEDLPFEDNEFDLAVFINSLEFMDNPLQALKEAGRVANRKVFVGVVNSLSLGGLYRRVQGYLGDPLFKQAKFYNLWEIRSLLEKAYGPVPLSWGCIRLRYPLIEDAVTSSRKCVEQRFSPFGFFLGLSANIVYRIKTDNLPLKVKLKKANQPLVEVGSLKRKRGTEVDERGLSI